VGEMRSLFHELQQQNNVLAHLQHPMFPSPVPGQHPGRRHPLGRTLARPGGPGQHHSPEGPKPGPQTQTGLQPRAASRGRGAACPVPAASPPWHGVREGLRPPAASTKGRETERSLLSTNGAKLATRQGRSVQTRAGRVPGTGWGALLPAAYPPFNSTIHSPWEKEYSAFRAELQKQPLLCLF